MDPVRNPERETPGIAGFVSGAFGTRERKTGDTLVSTITETVKAGQLLPIDTVVGKDATGQLVPATWSADDSGIVACGIMTATIDTSAAMGGAAKIDIEKTGMLNPNYMVWHDSFDTAEKRRTAFEGSLAPGMFMQESKYDNVADVPVELKASADFLKA